MFEGRRPTFQGSAILGLLSTLMGTALGYTEVSSQPEVATSAIKPLWNATAPRRAFVLFNCYVDTLFVSIIPEHLKNHRIMPRFFYR